jgi:hypothetical protein
MRLRGEFTPRSGASVDTPKARICGRTLRLVFGVCVMIVALLVWFVTGWGYNHQRLDPAAAGGYNHQD